MPSLRERMLALLLVGVMLIGTSYVPHHHHAEALCLHDEPTGQSVACDCQASHEACPTDCVAMHHDAPQAQTDNDTDLPAQDCLATTGEGIHPTSPSAAETSHFPIPSFHRQHLAHRGGLRAPPVFRIA